MQIKIYRIYTQCEIETRKKELVISLMIKAEMEFNYTKLNGICVRFKERSEK